METERQKLIARKAVAALQRAARRAYLEALPQPLRATLESVPFLCDPENMAIQGYFYPSKHGFDGDEPTVPTGLVYREFGWLDRAFALAAQFPDRHDAEPAFLQPFGVRRRLDISESPATFAVQFGWARRNLEALFEVSTHGVGLVSKSLDAGLSIHVYCGYPDVDPGPEEHIYAVGLWG